jgi:hypothetical protein
VEQIVTVGRQEDSQVGRSRNMSRLSSGAIHCGGDCEVGQSRSLSSMAICGGDDC